MSKEMPAIALRLAELSSQSIRNERNDVVLKKIESANEAFASRGIFGGPEIAEYEKIGWSELAERGVLLREAIKRSCAGQAFTRDLASQLTATFDRLFNFHVAIVQGKINTAATSLGLNVPAVTTHLTESLLRSGMIAKTSARTELEHFVESVRVTGKEKLKDGATKAAFAISRYLLKVVTDSWPQVTAFFRSHHF